MLLVEASILERTIAETMEEHLLAIEKLLDPTRRAKGRSSVWYGGWAAAAGMLASWLHPWQGITLLLIVAILLGWERFDRSRVALLLHSRWLA